MNIPSTIDDKPAFEGLVKIFLSSISAEVELQNKLLKKLGKDLSAGFESQKGNKIKSDMKHLFANF